MIRDLTGSTGQPVEESDDIKVTRHYYARSSDVKLIIVGALLGSVPGGILAPFTQLWSLLLVPLGMIVLPILFSRQRSRMGEVHENRWEKINDRRRMRQQEGLYVIPGSAKPFRPLDVTLMALSAHPLDPDRPDEWAPQDK